MLIISSITTPQIYNPNCVRGVVGQETSFDGPKSLRSPVSKMVLF